jgi:hypothetical protein
MCEGPPRQWDQYHNRPQPAIATDRPLLLKPRARHGPQTDSPQTWVSAGVFMLTLAAISIAARVLTGRDISWNKCDIWVVIAHAVWGFVHTRPPPVPILHPAWSGGWSGIASAFSMGIWVPSGMTTRTGTLTSRTPFSYRAVTSAASTLAGSLTVRASDP